jgi:hypothetical protein
MPSLVATDFDSATLRSTLVGWLGHDVKSMVSDRPEVIGLGKESRVERSVAESKPGATRLGILVG